MMNERRERETKLKEMDNTGIRGNDSTGREGSY